jgi:hypothetical protein
VGADVWYVRRRIHVIWRGGHVSADVWYVRRRIHVIWRGGHVGADVWYVRRRIHVIWRGGHVSADVWYVRRRMHVICWRLMACASNMQFIPAPDAKYNLPVVRIYLFYFLFIYFSEVQPTT